VQHKGRVKTGTLLSSNSNGTFYTVSLPHTSRDENSRVDYERVAGVSGIALANVVDNWDTAERNEDRQIKTKITFDDGGRWRNLKPPLYDNEGNEYGCANELPLDRCSLHLHSVTEAHNIGRMFSVKGAPGLLMGVGSVGEYLKPYKESDTFLSRDGGVTWILARRGPHKWEIGDSGGLLVMVPDGVETDEVYWSSDYGKTWQTIKLDQQIKARALTTSRGNDKPNFILVATPANGGNSAEERHSIISIDFSNVHTTKCKQPVGEAMNVSKC
jgi:hypothetical protein